ncbi:MAG: pepN, partial [Blastococcus sp.]|nr:pepN [Blastococcus sp.]
MGLLRGSVGRPNAPDLLPLPIRIGRGLFPLPLERPPESSSAHGKLTRVSAPNLTRTDAAARAELLAVQSYDIQLDVTDAAGHPGEHTFRSVTTVRFTSRQAGASTFLDLVAETVHSAILNDAELDVSTYSEDGGLPLPGLAGENTLVITADCAYSNTGEG